MCVLTALVMGCDNAPQTAQEPAKGMPASEQKIVAQKPPSPSAPPIASAAVTRRKPATVTPEEARKKLEEQQAKSKEPIKPLPEFGSLEDFQLRQALNQLQGKTVLASKTASERRAEAKTQ